MKKWYRVIDHTADTGLETEGDSLEEAFVHAAQGMFDILSDGSHIESCTSLPVVVDGADPGELLVNYLGELLYLFDVHCLLFGEFDVRISGSAEGWHLTGEAWGEPMDPGKHNYPLEIKAVTYHMLEVREDPPFVRVIFDL